MALITKDFIVNSGLQVLSTSSVSGSTGNTGGTQLNGGLAVAKNSVLGGQVTVESTLSNALNVTGGVFAGGPIEAATFTTTNSSFYYDGSTLKTPSLTVTNSAFVGGSVSIADTGTSALSVQGGASFGGNITVNGSTSTFNGALTITNAYELSVNSGLTKLGGELDVYGKTKVFEGTLATTAGDGALQVSGGVYIGQNLIVNSTVTNSETTNSNSIYTLGGMGVSRDLAVGGNVVITGGLTVHGTQTIVNSTQTAIESPIFDIGTAPNNAPLAGDDGYNKGIVIHYYDTGDNHMFLGRNNTTGHLVLRNNIDKNYNGEPPNGDWVNSGSYATFDLGTLIVHDATASTGTNTGALIVAGGVGVSQDVHIGGTLYAGQIYGAGGGSGSISASVSTASNLSGGSAGLIPIQSDAGVTTFLSAGSANNQVLTWKVPAPLEVSSTGTINTNEIYPSSTTGIYVGMQVTGTGISASTTYVTSVTNSVVTLTYNNSAAVNSTVTFISTTVSPGQIWPQWAAASGTTVGRATEADNLSGGAAKDIPFQSATSTTSFDTGVFTYDSSSTALKVKNVTIFGDTAVGSPQSTEGDVSIESTTGSSIQLFSDSVSKLNAGNNVRVAVANAGTSSQVTIDTNNVTRVTVDNNGGVTLNSYSVDGGLLFTDASGKILQNNLITYTFTTSTGALEIDDGFGNGSLTVGDRLQGNYLTVNQLGYNPGGVTFVDSTGSFNTAAGFTYTAGTGSDRLSVPNITATNSLYVAVDTTIGGDLYVGGNIYLDGVGLDTVNGTTATFKDVVSTGTITANVITANTINFAGSGVSLSAGTSEFNNIETTGTIVSLSTASVGINPGAAANGSNYSIATLGGLKAAKEIIAGGVVSAGDFASTGASKNPGTGDDSGSVDGFYLLNNMQAARTVKSVSGNSSTVIDEWDKNLYSSAKYTVQCIDGSDFHVEEIMIAHDGSDIYISEYGVLYNSGALGVFGAAYTTSSVALSFTPGGATSMTIQVVRQSILTNIESYV